MNINLTFFHFFFLLLSFNSYAQDCDDINISTNVESTYTLCNNSIDLDFAILNPEQYETVNWILDDGQYNNNQSYANFNINQVGLYTLTIQVEDVNGCLDSEQINFQILAELPPAPIINYVTVTPEQDVIIEWSSESLVDDLNTIDLYHQTSGSVPGV